MASVGWWHDVDVANLVRRNQIKIKHCKPKVAQTRKEGCLKKPPPRL